MTDLPQPLTDDTIKIRQLSHYQFSWVAGEPGENGAFGGSGVDFINIASAGPAASANCGPGRDKVRINRNEKKKIKNCETVYTFKDK